MGVPLAGAQYLSSGLLDQTKLTSIRAATQYYSFLNKDPARLHCFYTKRSTLIHGTEGEDSVPCYGQQVRSACL